jgi:hypothetical protein
MMRVAKVVLSAGLLLSFIKTASSAASTMSCSCDSYAGNYAASASRQGQVLAAPPRARFLAWALGPLLARPGSGRRSEQLLAQPEEVALIKNCSTLRYGRN